MPNYAELLFRANPFMSRIDVMKAGHESSTQHNPVHGIDKAFALRFHHSVPRREIHRDPQSSCSISLDVCIRAEMTKFSVQSSLSDVVGAWF